MKAFDDRVKELRELRVQVQMCIASQVRVIMPRERLCDERRVAASIPQTNERAALYHVWLVFSSSCTTQNSCVSSRAFCFTRELSVNFQELLHTRLAMGIVEREDDDVTMEKLDKALGELFEKKASDSAYMI